MTGSGNPFTPTTELRLNDLLALYDGEDDTANMKAWKAERDAETHAREQLGLVDLGAIMTKGVKPPEMLVPGLPFVKGVHTEMFGPKANGKTWIALWVMKELILRGDHVVWVDKEMGANYMASRLITLGVEPDVVTERFHYFDHPTFGGGKEPVKRWEMLLDAAQPQLIVFDARTEFLADGGLNENLGSDVAKWDSWYLNPAARRGIATCMIDHVGFSESGRQRGSGHKGNSAKVELQVDCTEKFDPDAVGKLKVTLRKNTHAAAIPEKQTFEIGGEVGLDGKSRFVFRSATATKDDDTTKARVEMTKRIIATMRERGATSEDDAMSLTQVRRFTKGRDEFVGSVLKDSTLDPLSPIVTERDGKTTKYWLDETRSRSFRDLEPVATGSGTGQERPGTGEDDDV